MRIGIDLGGTNIAAGILSDDCRLIAKKSIKTNSLQGPERVIGRMAGLVQHLCKENGVSISQVSAIGIGNPGELDREHGVVLFSNNLNWHNVPVFKLLSPYFQCPLFIENDANCAALGEYAAGAGTQYLSIVMVTIGTGIGGGFIIDGKLHKGAHSNANIIGHMSINSGGAACNCGRYGCWEAYASMSALIMNANTAADCHKDSLLTKVRASEGSLNGQNIFTCAKSGDYAALQVVNHFIGYLAQGICDIVNIFDPGAVIIGGGVSQEGAYILDPVRKQVAASKYSKFSPLPAIVSAKLGNDAGITGAAYLCGQC